MNEQIPPPSYDSLSWFDLEKYRPLKGDFSFRDWQDQIRKRNYIYELLWSDTRSDSTAAAVTRLFDCPLELGSFGFASKVLSDFMDDQVTPVRPMSFNDFDFLQYEVLEHRDLQRTPTEPIEDVVRRAGGRAKFRIIGEGFLVVDLAASDEDIKSEVGKWLKKRRASESISRSMQDQGAMFQRRMILPYFDLMAWKKWTGNRLSDGGVLEKLYPGQVKDVDALKPTRALFKALFVNKKPVIVPARPEYMTFEDRAKRAARRVKFMEEWLQKAKKQTQ